MPGNSARSVIAEVLLNTLSEGRVKAYSVASHPAASEPECRGAE